MPSSLLLLALFWLIFAPVFYFRVFQPCWDCYDFEATGNSTPLVHFLLTD